MANFKDGNIKFEEDLQDFFGFPRGTGIGFMITHAGADGRINKWAMFKPTRATGTTKPTNYWKGRDNDNPQTCALAQPISSSVATFMQTLASDGYSWTYLYPRGISYSPQEWFRAKDFIDYEHSAVCPLPAPPGGTVSYQTMHTFICGIPTQVAVGGLSLTDLYISQVSGYPSLETCYIGLLLYNGSTRHWKTAEQTIALGKGTSEQKHLKVAMNLTGMTGTWYARTFLCTQPITTQDATPSCYCIACEGVSTLNLIYVSGDYTVSVSAKWLSRSQYKVTATFYNGKSSAVSVTNMRIVVAFGLDQRTITIANRTLSAGEEWSYDDTYSYIYSSGGTATASANFGGTSKSATTNFIDP